MGRETLDPVAELRTPSGVASDTATPKLVFLDVDGTFVNLAGTVPPSAKAAVERARANGHRVFLCTGRSISQLWDSILVTPFDGVVAAAGGYVEVGGQVLRHVTFPVERVRELVATFAQHGIHFFLETNTGMIAGPQVKETLTAMAAAAEGQAAIGVARFAAALIDGEPLIRDDVNKIVVIGSAMPVVALAAELGPAYDVIPTAITAMGGHSAEISLAGVHKASAIELLAAHLGVDRADTIAFGDGPNDVEMIQWVGLGVAMGNAEPDIKALADLVVAPVDEDGLAGGFAAVGLI